MDTALKGSDCPSLSQRKEVEVEGERVEPATLSLLSGPQSESSSEEQEGMRLRCLLLNRFGFQPTIVRSFLTRLGVTFDNEGFGILRTAARCCNA